MDFKSINKSFVIPAFVVSLVLITGNVYSQSYDISGNASSSNNSVQLKQTESSTINQSNSANVQNDAKASSSTGGNSINNGVGGENITTGNATSNVNINNLFNNNNIDINCDKCVTLTPKPSSNPSPTSLAEVPTSTPTPSVGGSGGVGGPGGGEGGQGGAGTGQAPVVLGLSATSGDNSFLQIIPAFIFILLGYGFVKRNV